MPRRAAPPSWPCLLGKPLNPGLLQFLLLAAGALVLEELEHAKARGATILAEFVGGAFTSDAYSMTEPRPDGSGVAHCVQVALERCGLQPEQVQSLAGRVYNESGSPGWPALPCVGSAGVLRASTAESTGLCCMQGCAA